MWRRLRFLTILLVTAVVIHGFVLAAVHHFIGPIDVYAFQSLDSAEYYQIAQNVATDGAFSQSPEPPFTPDTWRTPGYPVFLALAMKVVGDSPTVLVMVQQVLGVINILLVFLVARFHMTERRAAITAAIVLFEPFHLYYSLWFLATTLFVTVFLLTWYTFEAAMRRGSIGRCATLGALCGVLVLIRPVALLVPFVVLLGLLALRLGTKNSHQAGLRRGKSRWRGLVTYAVVCATVVVSWMVRNKTVTDHFALSHQGGIVLVYFKAAEVELWRQGRTADRYIETSLNPARAHESHSVWDEIDRHVRERLNHIPADLRDKLRWHNLAQGNRTQVDSFEISAALTSEAISMMWSSPLATATCCLVRCGSILTFPLNQVLRPPNGIPSRRLRRLLLSSPYVVLVLAVLVTLVQRFRTYRLRANHPEAGSEEDDDGPAFLGCFLLPIYFPLACTLALLVATTPQIDPRFRVPMIPFLAFLAMLPAGVREHS